MMTLPNSSSDKHDWFERQLRQFHPVEPQIDLSEITDLHTVTVGQPSETVNGAADIKRIALSWLCGAVVGASLMLALQYVLKKQTEGLPTIAQPTIAQQMTKEQTTQPNRTHANAPARAPIQGLQPSLNQNASAPKPALTIRRPADSMELTTLSGITTPLAMGYFRGLGSNRHHLVRRASERPVSMPNRLTSRQHNLDTGTQPPPATQQELLHELLNEENSNLF